MIKINRLRKLNRDSTTVLSALSLICLNSARRLLRFFYSCLKRGYQIIVLLFIFSTHAYAATGVGITYVSDLAAIGGPGGQVFAPISCPSGQLITGFNFWNQNTGGYQDGEGVQAQCSTISLNGSSVVVTYAGTTLTGGHPSGTLYSGSCPAGQVVTGVDALATTFPVLGWFRLYCSPISYSSTTQKVTIDAAPASPSTGIIGPNYAYGGTYYDRVVATSGNALGGFSGRSGTALDQVVFEQFTTKQAALTLTANVISGSASASAFTLKATDSSSIVSNFSSGTTQVVVPDTYTFSGTGPDSSYSLQSVSGAGCSNQVTLANNGTLSCTLNFQFTYQPKISGSVLTDPLGNMVTGSGISGATVKLYTDTGVFVTSTTTDSSGNFTFNLVPPSSNYYVTVVSTNGAVEQTAANAGTGGGAGTGPICIGAQPTYTQQSSTTPSSWTVSSGTGLQACYGGRQGAVADAGIITGKTLTNDEHVIRVILNTSDVTGLQFVFSPNVVTNTNDAGQGSLRQFITNANAGSGTNVMRFVPAIATNASSGSNAWWKTSLTSTALPIITAATVTINGTPYSNVDGATVLAPNNYVVKTAQAVGYGASAATIGPVKGPQLEINALTTSTFRPVLGTKAASTIIQNIAATGGYDVGISADTGSSGFLLQNSTVGIDPAGVTSQSTYVSSNSSGIKLGDINSTVTTSGLSGTILNNAVRAPAHNILFFNTALANTYTVQNNFFLGSSNGGAAQFYVQGTTPGVVITNNYITGGLTDGIFINSGSNGATITGNTITGVASGQPILVNGSNGVITQGNNVLSSPAQGILYGGANNGTILANYVTGSANGGVVITNSTGNLISQNIFGTNGGNGIDLNSNGVSLNNTVCLNAGGSTSANNGLARPVITSTSLSGSTLTLAGTMCGTGTYTIEVFQTTTGAGDLGSDGYYAGHATAYLGSLTNQTGGVFSGTISGVNLTNADSISVTAIRTVVAGGGAVNDTSEFAANYNFDTISGTVFEDVLGNQGPQVPIAGVKVCGFLDNGDGIPNVSDQLEQCVTTAANGTYTMSAGLSGTYWVAVQASTVTPSQGGSGLAEQVYGPVGGQCINSSFAQTTLTTAGACYGGKLGSSSDGFTGTAVTLANAQHISKVIGGSSNITAQNFGFSFNVVTNVGALGQGSFAQFIANANSVMGANTLRFVPAVAMNISSGSASWWKVIPTAALLLSGTNAASTTIDGTAYSNLDGTTLVPASTGTLQAAVPVGYGVSLSTIPAIAAPQLEVAGSANIYALGTTTSNTTIQNISFTGGSVTLWAGAGSGSFTLQKSAIGVNPGNVNSGNNTYNLTTAAIKIGDYSSSTTTSGLTGLIHNNYIYGGSAAIQVYGLTGLSSGQYTLSYNYIKGTSATAGFWDGIDIFSSPNVNVTSNFINAAYGYNININASNGISAIGNSIANSNYSTQSNIYLNNSSNGSIIGNNVSINNLGNAVDLSASSNSNLIQANLLANSAGGSGVAVLSNSNGNKISQNIYGNNTAGISIDLNADDVTLNNSACLNTAGAATGNSGLARPVITTASLSGSTLTVTGTICNDGGTYTVEVYQAVGAGVANGTANNDMGADKHLAGEGVAYIGSITGVTGGTFSGTFTNTFLASVNTVSATAIRTTVGSSGAVGDTSEFAANVNFNTISGIVFEDVAGNQGAQVPVAGVNVCGFRDNGDGIPNTADQFDQCVTTAADGSYTLSSGLGGIYWVAVQASTVTPSQGGTGLAEQVYGPIGGQCVNSSFAQTTLTTAGPCYGGKSGSSSDGFVGTLATLANAQHISKVAGGTSNVTAQNFGFSFNVVTNVSASGQGSIAQFIANANSVVGANALRFVPAVATNAGSGSTSWWKVIPTTALQVTGANGASTTIDGTAYSNLDGVTVATANTSTLQAQVAVGYGASVSSIPAIAAPQFEVNGGANSYTLGTTTGTTTIQNIAVTGGNTTVWAGAGSGSFTLQKSAIGVTPGNVISSNNLYTPTTASIKIGDLTSSATNSGLTGLINNNYIYGGSAAIQVYGLTGLSSGQYTLSYNYIKGTSATAGFWDGIDIFSSPNVNVTSNFINAAYGYNININASNGISAIGNSIANSNYSTQSNINLNNSSNGSIIGNNVSVNNLGNGVQLNTSSNSNLIQANLLANSAGGSGVAVLSNSNGNKISQNIYGNNNAGVSIDLNADDVTLNSTACLNTAGAATSNSGLARPVITTASLSGSTLTVTGTICNDGGTYTIEVYQAAGAGTANGTANNDMGADNNLAGEGIAYIGNITGATGGTFSGTFTNTSLTSANTVSATAIRTAVGSNGIVGDTSEFAANANFNTISGMVYEDVVGNQGTKTARPGVTVCNFLDNGDGIPNNLDQLNQCVTTSATGTYSFSADIRGTYWVAVQASTITPSQGGSGLAEQVAGPLGGQCISGTTQVTLGAAGACFGGKTGGLADGFTGTTATLANAEHISKVAGGTSNITGQNFGFSFNVVTNTNDAGQGSVRQFLTNANGIVGTSSMLFVPAVAMNQPSWWKTTLSSGALPVLNGTNAASTTINGTPYKNTDGTTKIINSNTILGATSVGYGNSASTIAAVASPLLEINAPATSIYPQTLGSTAATTTIQYISLTGGYYASVWAGAGSNAFALRNNAIGVTPDGTASTQASTSTGAIQIGSINNVGSTSGITTGTIYHNVVKATGLDLLFSNVTGLSSGQYMVNNNFFLANLTSNINSVGIVASPNVNFTSNYVTGSMGNSVYVDASSGLIFTGNTLNAGATGANLALNSVSNAQMIGNIIQGALNGHGIHIDTSSMNNLFTLNQVINNNDSGIAVTGNANGNKFSQNIYGNNGSNAIDLGSDGVTLNSTACLNTDGSTIGNNNLARPVITSANLADLSTLIVGGTVCGVGTYTIEVYQSVGSGTPNGTINNDYGTDSQMAGEGIIYLGSLTASNGTFFGALTGSIIGNLTAGSNSITAIAIRTSGGVIGDTSEFSANFTIQNPNFGSAPDSYLTMQASGGAVHYIYTGLAIGTLTPSMTDGIMTIAPADAAGGDGVNVIPFPPLTLGTKSYSITVSATNNTSSSAKLIGWLDFNRNGVFDSAEGVSISVPANSGTVNYVVTWSNVQNLLNLSDPTQGIGTTYARFRLSTSASLTVNTPAGVMSDGEVEDYGGIDIINVTGSNITGMVFNDINSNSVQDTGEIGTGLTLYALLVPYNGSSCVGPALMAATVDSVSGNYTLAGAAPGTYCVIVSNDTTLTNITPYTPTGWSYTVGIPGQQIASVTATSNTQNVDFGLTNARILTGAVFYDTGVGNGIAYNGIQDGSEAGMPNTIVQMSYGSGPILETTKTDSSGQFSFVVPVTIGTVTFSVVKTTGIVNVSKGVTVYSDTSPASAYSRITLNAASINNGNSGSIQFGLGAIAQLEPNTIEVGSPGGIILHPHIFTAGSPGQVTFSYQNASVWWPITLYLDSNCNSLIDSTELPILAPITMTLGQTICVISRTQVLMGTDIGYQFTQDLQAIFNYQTGSINPNVSTTLKVSETTNIANGQNLQLIKAVDQNRANSGDILTYTISYKNLEVKPISNLMIIDYTVAYTSYVPNSASCVEPLPTGLTCVVTTDLDSANQGSVKWTLTGMILPGVSGLVTYQLKVQ